MSESVEKPLIAPKRPTPIRAATSLGQILVKLHGARVTYRYCLTESFAPYLVGSGHFAVEMSDGNLHCLVHGELFKPGPFEFEFHRFWLTRRGIILAVFDLAANCPPECRSNSEDFLHFTYLKDPAIRREAVAFCERPFPGRKR